MTFIQVIVMSNLLSVPKIKNLILYYANIEGCKNGGIYEITIYNNTML